MRKTIDESAMKTKGYDKTMSSIFNSDGTQTNVSALSQGMNIIAKETDRLWGIMQSNTNKKKPAWYKTIDSADKLSNVLMCISSKLVLTDTDVDYKRILIIKFVVDTIFKDDNINAGIACVEWIISECDLFTRHDKLIDGKTIVTFSLSKYVKDEIMNGLNYKAMNAFYCLPITVKPKDWKREGDTYTGGYHTKQLPLVKSGIEGTESNLCIDVSNDVLNALNIMQSTAWRINIDVLQALRKDVVNPIESDYIKTPKESNNEAQKEREKALYMSALGKYNALRLAINIAEDLKHEETIYFPMNMDSRGRCYSLPIMLQPQSESRIKALLEYSNGVVLTDDGIDQCYAYLCSLYGEDKLPYKERVLFGKTLVYSDYQQAEESYEFLALQLEIQKYEEDPTSTIHAHIHLDLSNNAIQIMSSITGDYAGCVASNVIPTAYGRQDIYTDVAKSVLNDEENKVNKNVLDKYIISCLEKNARKYSKKVVMTSAYGSTLYGDTLGILNNMSELDFNSYYMNIPTAMYFAGMLRDDLANRISGATKYMEWAKGLVASVVKDCGVFKYVTNDGFKVVIRKDKMKVKSFVGRVHNKQYKLNLNIKTGVVDVQKTVSSAVPSIIHSLDGMFLRELVRQGDKQCISNWGVIHDAVAVNPNDVAKLHTIARDVFANTGHATILDDIRTQTDSNYKKFEVKDIDISSVADSEWFFS